VVTAVTWHDSPGQTVWRADEVELVTAAPVRSGGPLGSLDAATLWISSLTVPTLAERVYRERQADLETRWGKLMALFHCAKIFNDSGAATGPVFELAAREAAKLVADLQS
jgi:hypothetical protein